MLPDFPAIKRRYSEAFIRYIKKKQKAHPFLGQIRQHVVPEGNRMKMIREDGEEDGLNFERISHKVSVTPEDIITKGPAAFIEPAEEVAQALMEQQESLFFRRLNESVQKVGNVVDGGGKKFTFDTYLELLKKVDIDFDENGIPRIPQLLVGSEAYERLSKLVPQWMEDPAFKELMRVKKKEWHDRESNRKLVD